MKANERGACPARASETQVPGGIYLCQVSETVSCGACCGVYNQSDLSRESVVNVLTERNRRFRTTPRTPAGIEAFAAQTDLLEPAQRPFEHLHACPFVGLIGDRHQRVGCLLHPWGDGNQGVDYRGMSYYGGMACRTFFCRTTHELEPRYKLVLRAIAQDWFPYGLIVTETDLLRALFRHLEARLGCALDISMLNQRPDACERLRELLELKIAWPFRSATYATACHYLFSDGLHPKPAIDYRRLDCIPSTYGDVLAELSSAFTSIEQLRQAEELFNAKLSAAAAAIEGHGAQT